jgi:hypothetical protein
MKTISIITFFIFSLILTIHLNFFSIKDKIYKKYPNLNIRQYIFKKEPVFNKLNNDYNVKFLPETELIKLQLNKKKIKFKKNYYNNNLKDNSIAYKKWGSFFIDLYENNLFITDYLGNFYLSKNIDNLTTDDVSLQTININSNLKNNLRVFDTLISGGNIYITYTYKENECKKIYLSYAKINFSQLKFINLFESAKCNPQASPGRIQLYKTKEKEGLLLSISSGGYNKPSKASQDKNLIDGKIILISLADKNFSIFSLGHRVIQGLFVDKELVLATEHGPRGGDEINLIKEKNNYGWPIASYGEKYNFDYELNPFYKKSHKQFGFTEPIYSYIPAIGISELTRLPNDFSNFFENVFIITSLYGRSIFLTKFSDNFERIIFLEKIFLNERIRDIKYFAKSKYILLAFEENGELGLLTKKTK